MGSQFSSRWRGTVQSRHSEMYTIYAEAGEGDGVRVWAGQQLLIDTWTQGGNRFAPFTFTAGVRVPIMVEYRHRTGSAKLRLLWSSRSQAKQVIPQSQLYPAELPPPGPVYASCYSTCSSDCPAPPTRMGGLTVKQDVPSTMVAGQTYPITIRLRNTGTQNWLNHGTWFGISTRHYLESYHSENWGRGVVELPNDVGPNDEVEFNFNVVAPTTPGMHNFQWGLGSFNQGGWQATPRILVEVVTPQATTSLDPPVVKTRAATSIQLQMPKIASDVSNLRLQRIAKPLLASATLPAVDMLAWLRADNVDVTANGQVNMWRDVTISNNDALQTSTNRQPRWISNAASGRPALRFDGVDDEMSLLYEPPIDNFAFFAVIRATQQIDNFVEGSQGYSNQHFLFNPSTARRYDWGDAGLSIGKNGIQAYEHQYASMPIVGAYSGVVGDNFTVVGWVYRGKQSHIWLNSSLVRTGLLSDRTSVFAPTKIGGGTAPASYATTGGFGGDVAEIIGYKSALTDAQCQNVMAYMMQKYDINATPLVESDWQTIATDLQSEAQYTDDNLTADTQYFYRCIADGPSGLLVSRSVGAHTLPLPPEAPAAPLFDNVTSSSVRIIAPPLPTRSYVLALQKKLSEEPESAFKTLIYMTRGEDTTVNGLATNRTYVFRFVAIGEGGQTPGVTASITTGLALPDPPDAPEIVSVQQTSFSVKMPAKPARATSLSLQYRVKSAVNDPYVTASSGRQGGETISVTGLNSATTYNVRALAIGGGGSTPGASVDIATGYPAPDAPAAPQFSDVGMTGLTVTAPTTLPNYAASLNLLCKMAGQSDESYQEVASGVVAAESVDLQGLASDVLYTFRYVAVGVGGRTAGASADVRTKTPVIGWAPSTSIQCVGIRQPLNGEVVATNSFVKLGSALAVDFDLRQVTVDGVTTSTRYSDPCRYSWSASGGSFKSGLTEGQSVVWIAPTTPGAYTITLVIDDQNSGNKPGYEAGTRDDASQGYNDDPVKFTTTVIVQ